MPQNDVANSGLGNFGGRALVNGSITCSVMPTGGQLGKMYENNPQFVGVLVPSGLNMHYGKDAEHRFSHSLVLT